MALEHHLSLAANARIITGMALWISVISPTSGVRTCLNDLAPRSQRRAQEARESCFWLFRWDIRSVRKERRT